ncbi:hypothetical protein CALCODRAFT_443112 [Calocera cornea HHB12733]|uniref:Alpha-type protein kinase domain-containing protein n=1 Tax=Calocera cornea HHB12733 TaxID=1353952 RepID=A0A165CUC1_9BASI|nr:hypothetical protein CALCODRAFT_443112 [Calocera cornea HHB12733]
MLGSTARITVDERAASALGPKGSFKTAHPGTFVLHEISKDHLHSSESPFAINTKVDVAFKRWYVPVTDGSTPPATGSQKGLVRLGKEQEEEKLAGEITCSTWASSLQAHVYRLIDKAKAAAGPDDLINLITFPKVRFVRCGLFRVQLATIPKNKNRATRHCTPYLVEELIPTDGQPEKFVKYIHNSSAVPRVTTGLEGNIATFLSFCQHVQYEATGKLVYVTDFQGVCPGEASQITLCSFDPGCNGLLTDPQIMTSP